ncbi:MAG: calcium:proton antiporter [Stenotrophomonas geniculata]
MSEKPSTLRHQAKPALLTSRVITLLAGSWIVVGVFTIFGSRWMGESMTPPVAAIIFLALFATILTASFGVVGEADQLADELGEPYGTLILTLSIVLIEVVLIASVLIGPGDNPTIGRDSIFAIIMIILNLVMGVSLIGGALRNGDQEFNAQGAITYLSMITFLTGIALVLPKFTSIKNQLSTTQAIGITGITAFVYVVFLWMQMRNRRHYFIQPSTGQMIVMPTARGGHGGRVKGKASMSADTKRVLIGRSALLIGLILPIVLLAHDLAVVTDYGIAALGAPVAVGGVLIAIIVFTPESITAIKAAVNNEMQRAINLCLGAFVSTVGLTVPAVLIIGMTTGKQVIMGISGMEVVLLSVTLLLTAQTLNGQRTSPIQGFLHLALFALFGLLLFYP